jgi:hypothetical protein
MDDLAAAKVDRSVLHIGLLSDPSDEKPYWLSQNPGTRIEALEIMRRISYGYDPAATRLQRLLEIAECPPR